MPVNTTQGSEQYAHQGLMTTADIPTTFRKYDLPGMITFQERATAKFDNLLRQAAPIITVTDPEPKVIHRDEEPVSLSVQADGVDSVFEGDTLILSDTESTWLQPGDVLKCPQIFCDSDGANYSTTKFQSGYTNETMLVKSVTLSGQSAGVSQVVVQRGNGANTSAPAAGVVTTMLSEYTLIRMGNALADGYDAPHQVDREQFAEQNFIQQFSVVWGEDSVYAATDAFGKETMTDKAIRKRQAFFRQIEFMLFDGRKGKGSLNNSPIRRSGGIMEFMPDATNSLDGDTRLIDFGGAFTLERQREIDEIVYRYGNASKIKDWMVGSMYFTVLFNNLEKSLVTNDALSRQYGWMVTELMLGHGLARLHQHSKFTEDHSSVQAFARDAVILDLKYLNLMVLKNHDVQLKFNIQGTRSHTREDELFTAQGLNRRFRSAHAAIYNIAG